MNQNMQPLDDKSIESTNNKPKTIKNRAISHQMGKEKPKYYNYSAKNSVHDFSILSPPLNSDYPFNNPITNEQKHSTGICPRHGLDYVMICNNDRDRVCHNCITNENDHRGHSFLPNSILFKNFEIEEEQYKNLEKKYNELCDNKMRIKDKIEQQLETKFEAIKQKVDQIVHDINMSLAKEKENIMKMVRMDLERFNNENKRVLGELSDMESFINLQFKTFSKNFTDFPTYAKSFGENDYGTKLQEILSQYEEIIAIPPRIAEKYVNELNVEEQLIVTNLFKFKKPNIDRFFEAASQTICTKAEWLMRYATQGGENTDNLLTSMLLFTASMKFDANKENIENISKPKSIIKDIQEDNLLESCDQNFLSIEDECPDADKQNINVDRSIVIDNFQSKCFDNTKATDHLYQSVLMEPRSFVEQNITKTQSRNNSISSVKKIEMPTMKSKQMAKSRSFIKKKGDEGAFLQLNRKEDKSVDLKSIKLIPDNKKSRKNSNTPKTNKNSNNNRSIKSRITTSKLLTKRAHKMLESVNNTNGYTPNVIRAIELLNYKSQSKKLCRIHLTDLDIANLLSSQEIFKKSVEIDFSDNKLTDDGFSICMHYLSQTTESYTGTLNFSGNNLTIETMNILHRLYTANNNVPLHTLYLKNIDEITKNKFGDLFNKLKKKYGLAIEI